MEKSQKEIIKEICKEFECTQKELAEKLGVHTGTINQWSANTRKIPNWFYKFIEALRELRQN